MFKKAVRNKYRFAIASTATLAAMVVFATVITIVLAAEGDLDATFNTTDDPTTVPAGVSRIHFGANSAASNDNAMWAGVQSTGKVVLAGMSNFQIALTRLNANGSIDTTFGPGGSNGKVLIPVPLPDSPPVAGSLQYNRNPSFVDATMFGDKIIIVGNITFGEANGGGAGPCQNGMLSATDFLVIVVNADGTLDTGFNTTGQERLDMKGCTDGPFGIGVQTDGKIVVGGTSTETSGPPTFINTSYDTFFRLNTNGTFDTSYDTADAVPDGKKFYTLPAAIPLGLTDLEVIKTAGPLQNEVVLLGQTGSPSDFVLNRLDTHGEIDMTFGPANTGFVTTHFGAAGQSSQPSRLVLYPDGRILAGGSTSPASGNELAAARYDSDGAIDNAGFGVSGKQSVGGFVLGATPCTNAGGFGGMLLGIDGLNRVIMGAHASCGGNEAVLTRLTSAGVLDAAFATGGKLATHFGTNPQPGPGTANSVNPVGGTIQPDGKIIMPGGINTSFLSDTDFFAARFVNTVVPPVVPMTIVKNFGAASIPLNSSTTLTFTINNPDPATQTGIAFTDTLPAGMVVSNPNGLTGSCGGGTITGTAGSGSVVLAGATLASGAGCTFSVNVTGTTAGTKNNTVQISSTEGGLGNTSNTSVTIVAPPVIIKAFGAATVPLNGSTTLTFTVQNNNAGSTLAGVGFTDSLPAGLVVATPNGISALSGCGGGTATAVAGSGSVSLATATVAAASSCTFSINVTGTTAGPKNNTTGNITSTEGGTGGTASASLNVVAPPSIAKAFNPTSIALNGTSVLTFTLTNPGANTVAENGVAFTDNLPANVIVGTPNGLTSTCPGTTTAVAGSGSISLTGGTIAANSSCAITVNVTATAAGQFTNTTSAVSSTNGGTGNTASAVLTVLSSDLSITKTDGVTSAPAGSTVTYTIIATNAGPSVATGATVVDTFPAAITNTQWTCVSSAGSSCAASGTGNINQPVNLLVGGTATFTVAATISPSAAGVLSNTSTVAPPAGVTDPVPANNTATDTDTLTAPSVFVIDDVQKLEGQSGTTPFVFTVSKNGGTGFATAVQYQTFDGTATIANSDYQATSGMLNFGPLETQKTITVLVNGDTAIEPNETFFVRLSNNPVNGLIGDGEGQGTIINDDPGATPTPTPTPPNRFEGDINRTAVGVPGTGDGDVNIADQLQYQKFLSGADCPSLNEQPRLDAGPIASKGDGLFGSADGTAIDAYARHDAATDFDPNTPGWQPTPAGGPATITNLGCTPSAAPESENTGNAATVEPASATAARIIRVVSRSGARNSDIMVDIEMAAQGNEAGTQYGLHFDPTILAISDVSGVNVNPDVMLGAGAPSGTTLNVNADDAATGNIGIVENFSAAAITALPEGGARIARVRFHVLDGAASGTSRVDFDSSVINGVTSDANGMVLSSNYEGGDVSVSSSRGVTVSGRVTSSDGRGIRGATVTIVDGEGFAMTATTSSFGYYTIDDVAAATYTIGVSSRQYRFGSRTITVGDNLADVDFTGLE